MSRIVARTALILLCALAPVAAQAENTFTVTNTEDGGPGSLRQAILDANAATGFDVIEFDISGGGRHVIAPLSTLPAITSSVRLDGLSQPGADCSTWPPTLLIEISGADLSSGAATGLELANGSNASTILGLVIRDFDQDSNATGLLIKSNANRVHCTFIGTDASGLAASGNTRGITLSEAHFAIIGSDGAAGPIQQRNLISGNADYGLIALGNNSNDNVIAGNLIGTDVTGTAALGGAIGISISAPTGGPVTAGNIIGYDGIGDPELMRNVISGHDGDGIQLGNNTRRIHVAGNYIGLDATGTAAVPNDIGIFIGGGSSDSPHRHHVIGWDGADGQMADQRNVISGNATHGVSISYAKNVGNWHVVVGNYVGTDIYGDTAIPNGFSGLSLTGGSAASQVLVHGNLISGNPNGIQLFAEASAQHPEFWNGVEAPQVPNFDSTDNCVDGNGAGIVRHGVGPAVPTTFIENWWGAADGPAGAGSGSGDSIPGDIDYEPFVTAKPGHCSNSPAAPAIDVTPDPVAFGNVVLGAAALEIVTVSNLGTADLEISSLAIVGDPLGQFELDSGSNDCATATVAPGDGCGFTLRYTPGQVGSHTATLEVSSNADPSPYEVELSGSGVLGPIIELSSAAIDFGDVELGTTSPTEWATLANKGSVDLTGISFSAPGNGFAVDSSDCGGGLSVGQSCQVGVTFDPPALGPFDATVTVGTSEGATAGVALAGNGVNESAVAKPVALAVDFETLISDGNGVFELGERVEVAPAWRNDGAFSQFFNGMAFDFAGPVGPDYALVVDDADYGEVDASASASCQATGSCYQMDIGPLGAARPARHWDTTFDETLSDGSSHAWTLHVGDTFPDTPRAHSFYRFIETLIHNGITVGCTSSDYCPNVPNNRAQMAVFLLRSFEGPDYVPPACEAGSQVFVDVPFNHNFCSWIEEIYRRGVTAGCGGGRYCPVAPMTRAQMSTFLLKTLEGSDYTPPACVGLFDDVACPSSFGNWIEDLYNRGITSGCSTDPLGYCPGQPVTRGQMSVFLTRTFGLELYGP